MNPLSAINAYVRPNGVIGLMPKIGQPGAIPAAELQQLTAANPAATAATPPAAFDNVLTALVQGVTAKQAAASQAVSGLLGGENVSLHQTMIAMEEASVSFQLMVEVRNKLLESYQELMRMQI